MLPNLRFVNHLVAAAEIAKRLPHQEQRKNLYRQYTKLGRAMSLRETLQAIYANSDRQVAEAELHWVVWLGRAQSPQASSAI